MSQCDACGENAELGKHGVTSGLSGIDHIYVPLNLCFPCAKEFHSAIIRAAENWKKRHTKLARRAESDHGR